MLTKEQIASCVTWEKNLPRHVQREQIKRAFRFGEGDPFTDKVKLREVLQQTACLAEALMQIIEAKP